MKKIGFVISESELSNWNGGISYYKNIINLIKDTQDITIFTDSKNFVKKRISDKVKIVENRILKKKTFFYVIRKSIIFILKKDLILFNLLKKNKIDILSHRKLFKNNKIKSIGWIPDLQQKVLSKFFDTKYLKLREKYIESEIENSDKIFVSSNQIKKEFKTYYNLTKKVIALRVPSVLVKTKIENKINLVNKFLLFPAQFWQHKNHLIILQASEILKKEKVKIKFILTGHTSDYRSKTYFKYLKKKIIKNKLNDYVVIKGQVNEKQLQQFQVECLAFINPSFYEGWSTPNEEARAINKYIFLSNIPGHIEQSNPGSVFFSPKNPDDLVKNIKNFLKKKTYLNNKYLINDNRLFHNKIKKEILKKLSKVYK
jgi:glycosyltransferase involved in cell wall biosynthesis